MKLGRLIFLILAVGIITAIVLVYFYLIQRDFTKNHREFLISLNHIDHTQEELENMILQSSIYTYNNQDAIAHTINKIYVNYDNLINSNILQNDTYKSINYDLSKLKKDIDYNLENIEEYLMLNAGIKNSLLFLKRYINNATYLKEARDKQLFVNAYQILEYFHKIKNTQDLDYINNNFLLQSNSKDKMIKDFVHNFNMHSNYILKKYPNYINKTKQILNNDIDLSINKIRDNFSEYSLNDFKDLDIFAFVLFTIFIAALSLIVILFMKYQRENMKLETTKESLEYSLTYDHLTNLYNRRAFEEELKTFESPHILLVNVDSFKHINDIYGNEVGNSLLISLSNLIKDEVAHINETRVYRLGGDEFGILFNFMDSQRAYEVAKTLEENISKYTFIIDTLELNILVSVATNQIEPILENADLALKLLKNNHAIRVIQYKDTLNLKRDIQKNMEIINILKHAIDDDRIIPFFQPIINLKTSKIIKYEALVRIKLENGTILPPDKFLDIAKKTPYYQDITEIMLSKTLKIAENYPKQRFSINISMIDIMNDQLVTLFFNKLQENLSSASRIDIELLESENLHDISKVQDFIKEVKKFGCKILIDDFGSGYANFTHFSNLDVDYVKIDGSIVKEITTDEKKLHMFTSIHNFSKGMSMPNIAEFVETKEIAMKLKDMGIEFAQGYYFSKPVPMPLESDDVII